jgi:hypothetical protein
MSVGQTDGDPNKASSASQSGKKLGDVLRWVGGVVAIVVPVVSIAWAAYTYHEQVIQQRKQDYLRAYDIVHGNLGKGIAESIDAAIKSIYNSRDDKLAKERQIVSMKLAHKRINALPLSISSNVGSPHASPPIDALAEIVLLRAQKRQLVGEFDRVYLESALCRSGSNIAVAARPSGKRPGRSSS